MSRAHTCDPMLKSREGAEHTGMDWFLECRCGRRTTVHYEGGVRPDPVIVTGLRRAWRTGETTNSGDTPHEGQ